MYKLIIIYYTQSYVLFGLPLCRLRCRGLFNKKIKLDHRNIINRMSLKLSSKLKGWFVVNTRHSNDMAIVREIRWYKIYHCYDMITTNQHFSFFFKFQWQAMYVRFGLIFFLIPDNAAYREAAQIIHSIWCLIRKSLRKTSTEDLYERLWVNMTLWRFLALRMYETWNPNRKFNPTRISELRDTKEIKHI